MNTFAKTSVLTAIAASLACAVPVCAEEGGSGHYLPGSMASFIDSVPPSPVVLMRLNIINYEGSAAPKLTLPVAGLLCSDLDATVTGYGLTFLWRPAFIDLGEGWSYAMSTTIPLITSEVSASAVTSRIPGRRVALDDDETGLGDIILMPIMISRTFTPGFQGQFAPGHLCANR